MIDTENKKPKDLAMCKLGVHDVGRASDNCRICGISALERSVGPTTAALYAALCTSAVPTARYSSTVSRLTGQTLTLKTLEEAIEALDIDN